MSSQPAHGNLSMVFAEPESSRIGSVRVVGKHEKSCKAPNDSDDRIDNEEPPLVISNLKLESGQYLTSIQQGHYDLQAWY